LLSGDIRPEQWLTGAGENGFFDALANGPVRPIRASSAATYRCGTKAVSATGRVRLATMLMILGCWRGRRWPMRSR
jgi:hypothetical protein